MNTLKLMSILSKALLDSEALGLLVEVYNHIVSKEYEEKLNQDPKLKDLVQQLRERF